LQRGGWAARCASAGDVSAVVVTLAAANSTTSVALTSLFVVCIVAAIVPILSQLLPDKPPQVVLLLLGGIIVGPSVLNLAKPEPIELLSDLGLGFLFLLAGYEIDPAVLGGALGKRAIGSWVGSLIIATGAVLTLQQIGFLHAPIPIAIGLSTTALGTLLPILRDRGMLDTDLARAVTVCGAVGELCPVLAIAVVLGAYSSWLEVIAIAAITAVGWLLIIVGRKMRGTSLDRVLGATAHGTGQATLRWTMVVLVGLLILTSRFGIDSVLGAFLAGFILRNWAGSDVEESFNTKLDTIGYGLLIPVFFVVSGMSLDLGSIGKQPLRLLAFLGLIILARGLPSFLVFIGVLPALERLQLAFLCSTTLPLLVAVSILGVQAGEMLPANAAALVGAGMVSVAVCPFIGIRLLGPLAARRPAGTRASPDATTPLEAGEPLTTDDTVPRA
jgi:Kef-type K+ transport system membrane component KefB